MYLETWYGTCDQDPTDHTGNTGPWSADNQSCDLNNGLWLVVCFYRLVSTCYVIWWRNNHVTYILSDSHTHPWCHMPEVPVNNSESSIIIVARWFLGQSNTFSIGGRWDFWVPAKPIEDVRLLSKVQKVLLVENFLYVGLLGTRYSRTPIYRDARGKGLCPVNRGARYIGVKYR